MSQFPKPIDGQPPVITLAEYDEAPWAKDTAVDLSSDDGYIVVDIINESHEVIAKIHKDDHGTLDTIFKSAKQQFAEQQTK
ncbi:hypothetical protein WICMUC_002034 [Wickerhamomyces mucosus]|uniref:Uncharacterized protein n=1 Tax=Wickerhamomyces mucosus TaxID=1378264 RepID=A0A9P8PQE6_9ASCO|nr:hypothetical protein WICMUC_002034 [Wickerhamomyces mucosus]